VEQIKEESKKKAGEAQGSSEFSAMKQEEQMKERILAGATRIYQQDEVNPLLT